MECYTKDRNGRWEFLDCLCYCECSKDFTPYGHVTTGRWVQRSSRKQYRDTRLGAVKVTLRYSTSQLLFQKLTSHQLMKILPVRRSTPKFGKFDHNFFTVTRIFHSLLCSSPPKLTRFDHKIIFTITSSFQSLLRSSLQKFREFKQLRGLLRRRLWKVGVTVRIFYIISYNSPNFWVDPRISANHSSAPSSLQVSLVFSSLSNPFNNLRQNRLKSKF
jgi:hypothetical protein